MWVWLSGQFTSILPVSATLCVASDPLLFAACSTRDRYACFAGNAFAKVATSSAQGVVRHTQRLHSSDHQKRDREQEWPARQGNPVCHLDALLVVQARETGSEAAHRPPRQGQGRR